MDGLNVPRIAWAWVKGVNLYGGFQKYGALVASLSLSTMKMSKSQYKFVIHDLLLVYRITSHSWSQPWRGLYICAYGSKNKTQNIFLALYGMKVEKKQLKRYKEPRNFEFQMDTRCVETVWRMGYILILFHDCVNRFMNEWSVFATLMVETWQIVQSSPKYKKHHIPRVWKLNSLTYIC